jgi:hypothetical protein
MSSEAEAWKFRAAVATAAQGNRNTLIALLKADHPLTADELNKGK